MNNQQREINPLSTISAKHLQELQLPPVRYIINEMLPQGLALLVSPPKYGKSWFCLDLCLSVADGIILYSIRRKHFRGTYSYKQK